MAVEPEEGGKLAHGRLQSTLPVRAKTRRQTKVQTEFNPNQVWNWACSQAMYARSALLTLTGTR